MAGQGTVFVPTFLYDWQSSPEDSKLLNQACLTTTRITLELNQKPHLLLLDKKFGACLRQYTMQGFSKGVAELV